MHIRLLQSLLVTISAVYGLENIERTIADGMGDAHAEGAHVAWTYNGLTGPINWKTLYPTCGGNAQSPINIEPNTVDFSSTLDGVVHNEFGLLPYIDYPNQGGSYYYTGDALKFIPTDANLGKFIRGKNAANSTYKLLQFHFHAPSEHRVDGEDYPMEVHFVHTMADGANTKLAVIGAFIVISDVTSPFLAQFVGPTQNLVGTTKTPLTNVDFTTLVSKIQSSTAFFRYAGSLTTPPCTEGVQFLIASDPVLSLTLADYNVFKAKLLHNARLTQPVYNFWDDSWVSKRKSDYDPDYTPPEPPVHSHLQWNYNGASGPINWGLFNDACNGGLQSPINIEPTTKDFAETLDGVVTNPNGLLPAINWPSLLGVWKNTGHSIQFNAPSNVTTSFERGDGLTWKLLQFHFHSPSEHRIDGEDYPLEIHFVHTSNASTLAVIGGFIEYDAPGTTSPFIKQLVDASISGLPMNDSKTLTVDFSNAVTSLKSSKIFYRYTGSLTAPPCLEGVNWLVAGTPIFKIDIADFGVLKSLLGHNSRPTQPIANFYDADWISKRKSNYVPLTPATK